jgi:hypothetical protein
MAEFLWGVKNSLYINIIDAIIKISEKLVLFENSMVCNKNIIAMIPKKHKK